MESVGHFLIHLFHESGRRTTVLVHPENGAKVPPEIARNWTDPVLEVKVETDDSGDAAKVPGPVEPQPEPLAPDELTGGMA